LSPIFKSVLDLHHVCLAPRCPHCHPHCRWYFCLCVCVCVYGPKRKNKTKTSPTGSSHGHHDHVDRCRSPCHRVSHGRQLGRCCHGRHCRRWCLLLWYPLSAWGLFRIIKTMHEKNQPRSTPLRLRRSRWRSSTRPPRVPRARSRSAPSCRLLFLSFPWGLIAHQTKQHDQALRCPAWPHLGRDRPL